MFAVIYKFIVKEGMEDEFRKYWRKVTEGIYMGYGSLGSRLHLTNTSNVFVAYAQWPDKETWQENKRPRSAEYEKAFQKMKECLIELETLHELEMTDDYLHDKVFRVD